MIIVGWYFVLPTTNTNFGGIDYKNIVAFLKTNNLSGAVIQELSNPTSLNSQSIWLIKQDGSENLIFESKFITDCGDFGPSPCINDALRNFAGYKIGLSGDQTFLFSTDVPGIANDTSPVIYDLKAYFPTKTSSSLWSQLGSLDTYFASLFLEPQYANCTVRPYISPDGRYAIDMGSLYALDPGFPLKEANSFTDNISKSSSAHKLADLYNGYACSRWSLDGTYVFSLIYSKDGLNAGPTATLLRYDLQTKQTEILTKNFDNTDYGQITAVISPTEILESAKSATYDVKFVNGQTEKTQLLGQFSKLVGIIK